MTTINLNNPDVTQLIRTDLVDDVRGRIEAGTYETPEKLDAAMDAMMRDLAMSEQRLDDEEPERWDGLG